MHYLSFYIIPLLIIVAFIWLKACLTRLYKGTTGQNVKVVKTSMFYYKGSHELGPITYRLQTPLPASEHQS